MKKFKIKNRQKRKYTRKVEAQAPVPFSYSLALSSLPFLILTLGLVGSFALMSFPYQQLQQPVEAVTQPLTLPSLALPTITLLILPSFPTTPLPSLPSVPSVPKFSIHLPTISINLAPLQAFLIGVGAAFMTFFLFLTELGKTFIQTMAHWIQLIIIMETVQITKNAVTFSQNVMKGSQILFLLGLSAIIIVTNTAISAVGFVENITWIFLRLFLHVSSICIEIIVTTTQQVISVLVAAWTTLVYYIELPFKIGAVYLEKSEPYFVLFGKLVENAANEFTRGVDNLASITSSLAKLSQK